MIEPSWIAGLGVILFGIGLLGVLVGSIYILRALGLRPPRSRMSVEVGGPDSTLV